MNRKLRFLITCQLALQTLVFSSAQTTPGWQASPEVVKRLSASRTEFNYYEEKVPAYVLPALLVTSSGVKVTNARQWNETRRQEVLELFREHVYGRVPDTKYSQEFRLAREDRNAIGGAATLKQVEILITANEKPLTIKLTLFTPNKTGMAAPVFLLIDNRGPANTDPDRKVKSEFWPVEEAIGRGYGMAVFSNADLDPDNYDEFKNGIHALLDPFPRSENSWGTLAAWAWGASRCMDYLVTDKDVDPLKVAVLGHSRGGKTALWAGAEDKRFAIVISNESGCGGAALARRRFGETVERINAAFPHWFCGNYRKYGRNEDNMPVDMHMLLALTAPRAIYVASADEDLWADPKGSYLALLNALPVYRLLGHNPVLGDDVPPLNKQVISGRTGYHIRNGAHNMLLSDWQMFMNFADSVYK